MAIRWTCHCSRQGQVWASVLGHPDGQRPGRASFHGVGPRTGGPSPRRPRSGRRPGARSWERITSPGWHGSDEPSTSRARAPSSTSRSGWPRCRSRSWKGTSARSARMPSTTPRPPLGRHPGRGAHYRPAGGSGRLPTGAPPGPPAGPAGGRGPSCATALPIPALLPMPPPATGDRTARPTAAPPEPPSTSRLPPSRTRTSGTPRRCREPPQPPRWPPAPASALPAAGRCTRSPRAARRRRTVGWR